MTIKVEKGIPLPPSRSGKRKGEYSFPFADMEIGDSFEIPIPENYKNRKGVLQSSVLSNSRTWAKWHKKERWKITSRVLDNCIRFWRIQ